MSLLGDFSDFAFIIISAIFQIVVWYLNLKAFIKCVNLAVPSRGRFLSISPAVPKNFSWINVFISTLILLFFPEIFLFSEDFSYIFRKIKTFSSSFYFWCISPGYLLNAFDKIVSMCPFVLRKAFNCMSFFKSALNPSFCLLR